MIKLPIYKPKFTSVKFNCKHIPRAFTHGVRIVADSENYNKTKIAHAYIHLNGKIEFGLNDKMMSEEDNNNLVIKVLVRHNYESNKLDSLRNVVSTTDWLLASQLDAIAWLCRKWFLDYNITNVKNECGDMFPYKLLTKYISNDGFTKYV
tara:strand:- start:522 stop:971 length:450 start_codon:yes stop_codon:yes gene_type:complete